MLKLTIILVTFLLSCFLAEAQHGATTGRYNRNALTVLVLDNGQQYSSDIVKATKGINIPHKFDDNLIKTRVIEGIDNITTVENQIVKNKIPTEIVEKWFNRDSITGEFSMSVVHERGLYNATADEIAKASATKRGISSLKDAGELLLNHSYIFVLSFSNIETMKQVYDRRDLAKMAAAEAMDKNYVPVRRVKTGWVGDAQGYLFKLNISDSLIDVFYNDMWIYEDDPDSVRIAKRERFDKFSFPVEYVGTFLGKADGTQYKQGHSLAQPRQLTRNELFQKMVNTGLSSCVEKTEKVLESFKVKAPVYKVSPVRAKIGKKEGLKTDDRYLVWESIQKKDGEQTSKRRGVVRVKKSIDNRKIAQAGDTDFSVFYQVAGKKISSGMTLYQHNDFGIGISGGVSYGEIGGGWGKVEFNIARIASGVGDLGITQLKIFGSIGFDNKTYNFLNKGTDYNFSFSRWQAGISKGFYFAHNFSLAPFVAFGAESGSNEQMNRDYRLSYDDFIGADFFNTGITGTVNIFYFMQIYSTFNYILPFPYTYTEKRNIFDLSAFQDKKYTDFFEDRRGVSIDLGIRIEF